MTTSCLIHGSWYSSSHEHVFDENWNSPSLRIIKIKYFLYLQGSPFHWTGLRVSSFSHLSPKLRHKDWHTRVEVSTTRLIFPGLRVTLHHFVWGSLCPRPSYNRFCISEIQRPINPGHLNGDEGLYLASVPEPTYIKKKKSYTEVLRVILHTRTLVLSFRPLIPMWLLGPPCWPDSERLLDTSRVEY